MGDNKEESEVDYMPRIQPSKKEMQGRILVGAIENQLRLIKMKKPELSKKTGIPASTMYRKFNHPEEFSVEDLQNIFLVIRMPKEEKQRIAGEVL